MDIPIITKMTTNNMVIHHNHEGADAAFFLVSFDIPSVIILQAETPLGRIAIRRDKTKCSLIPNKLTNFPVALYAPITVSYIIEQIGTTIKNIIGAQKTYIITKKAKKVKNVPMGFVFLSSIISILLSFLIFKYLLTFYNTYHKMSSPK